MKGGLALLAVPGLALLMPALSAAAAAGTMQHPGAGFSVSFDEALWEGSLDAEEDLSFDCKADACGGYSAACIFMEIEPEMGLAGPDYLSFAAESFDDKIAGQLALTPGTRPEIVEPSHRIVSGAHDGLATSIRVMLLDVPMRFDYAALAAGDIVVVASCLVREDDFVTAEPAFDRLVAGLSPP